MIDRPRLWPWGRRIAPRTPRRSHGHVVGSRFQPHPLLRNAHLQTVLPELLLRKTRLPIRRERLELPDGDFVDLGWCGAPDARGPIAVLVHGLAGSFRANYLRTMATTLLARGWRPLILQLRGAGDEPNRLARCYHHGDTADFHHVCRLLRAREPQTPLVAIGWSLGANVVIKALGEDGGRSPLSAAAAISAPFSLSLCAERLRRGVTRLYQALMLSEIKRMIRRKHAAMAPPEGIDLEQALAAADFFALGDAYTAPVNGFADAADFCARNACGPYLEGIERPTLVLHALDDPFMDPSIVPPEHALAREVRLEVSAHGGHVGFVGALGWGRPLLWPEQRIPGFLKRSVARAQRRISVGVRRAGSGTFAAALFSKLRWRSI